MSAGTRRFIAGWLGRARGARRHTGRAPVLLGLAPFIAVLLLFQPSGGTQKASTPDEPVRDSLAGKLLVASPQLQDPGFAQTVIYMMTDDADGAVGLVVNRPGPEITYAKLFEALGIKPADVPGKLTVFAGGPVEPERAFLLHTPDVMVAGSNPLPNGLAVTSDPAMLRSIAEGKGPAKHLLIFGYAGWGPKQLAGEIARGDWFSIPTDLSLIFADDPAKTWQRAQDRRPTSL